MFIDPAFAETAQQVVEATSSFIEWKINVGTLVAWLTSTALVMIGGVWWVSKFHSDVEGVKNELRTVKETLGALKDVLVVLAQHNEKFASTDRRLSRLEVQYDELRRGHGFIVKDA
jgi:hypothetical protein